MKKRMEERCEECGAFLTQFEQLEYLNICEKCQSKRETEEMKIKMEE